MHDRRQESERPPGPRTGSSLDGRQVADAFLRPAQREPAAAPEPPMRCESWKPVRKGTLQGFADLVLPRAGLRLLGCNLHERDGSSWVNPPARELRDAAGNRTGWTPVVEFTSQDARRAWSAAAVEAIIEYRRRHPEADAPREEGFEW